MTETVTFNPFKHLTAQAAKKLKASRPNQVWFLSASRLFVSPDLDSRYEKQQGKQRKQHRFGNQSKQSSSCSCADNRSRCHNQDKCFVSAKYDETAVATVTSEADQHGRQAYGQRETAGQLDIDTEEQYDSRYQQFTTCDTKQCSYMPIRNPATIPASVSRGMESNNGFPEASRA